MQSKVTTTLTVVLDGEYWSALFECIDESGYSVAKATISRNEPSIDKIENFLKNLNRFRLQYVTSKNIPVTTKEVVVEKKFKYEKKRVEVVPLKNVLGQAKVMLQNKKYENQELRRQKEREENREKEEYKRMLKDKKRKEKQSGK